MPPVSARFVPELSDEFASPALDPTRWVTAHPYYPGRPPGRIDPALVTVRDGRAQLTTQAGPNGAFATPFLRLRQEIRYGYFESRAQLGRCRVNQAFWLYAWRENGTREIDIFEMAPGAAQEAHRLHANLHVYNGNPADENYFNRRSMPLAWEAPDFDPTQWHIYGFLWTPTLLRWYVDDRPIREAANTAFHWPMALTFTGEIHPTWFGTPTAGELPCTLQIDFLRVWQLLDEK
jgi:hypothetical protein